MRTTAKQVTDKVQEHILRSFFDWERGVLPQQALKNQINYMKHDTETDYQAAKRLVEGGQFFVYHYDVNDFMNDLDINDKQKDYDDKETWDLYVHLLSREICKLIN